MSQTPTPTPPEPPARTRAPRWMRIVLVISLALNLAVLGMVAGLALRAPSRGAMELGARDLGYAPFVFALDRDQRRALGQELRRAPGLRADRDERRALYLDILAALRAEPYDPAALEQALLAQRQAISRRQVAGAQALMARIDAMPSAERAAYADRLEEILTRPRGHGRDGGGREGGGPGKPPRE